jgi:hypothetical protein
VVFNRVADAAAGGEVYVSWVVRMVTTYESVLTAPVVVLLSWNVACAFNVVAEVPIVVSALSAVKVRPLPCDEATRKLPRPWIAFGLELVSFGSPFMMTKVVVLGCVRSWIVTVIS